MKFTEILLATSGLRACCLVRAVCLLYYLIPSKRIPKQIAAVSALVATTLWEIAIQLFGYSISNFNTLGRIYGIYILMVVVAFWIYYSSVIFIIGAEVGGLYWQKKKILSVGSGES